MAGRRLQGVLCFSVLLFGVSVFVVTFKGNENYSTFELADPCSNVADLTGSGYKNLLRNDCLYYKEKYRPVALLLNKLVWYVSWHREQVAKKKVNDRTLLWKCLKPHCGGYGDQVRGMSLLLLHAVMSERVLFIEPVSVYRGQYDPGPDVLIPRAVDWRIFQDVESFVPPIVEFVDNGPYFPSLEACSAIYNSSRATQNVLYTTQHWQAGCLLNTTAHTDNLLLAQFRTLPPDDDSLYEFLATILSSILFQYSAKVLQRMQELKLSMSLSESPYIGVHIRTGLFTNGLVENINRGQITANQWESQIQCSLRKAKSVGVKGDVVVVSESNECKEWLARKFPQIVRTADLSASVLHCAKNRPENSSVTEFLGQSFHQERYFDDILSNVAELALLSLSDVIIQESSGFSRAAKWIGGIPSELVFCCFSKCNNYHVLQSGASRVPE